MQNSNHYYVENFELIVDASSYMVEIRKLEELPCPSQSISDLPRWVFESRLAIWISDRGTSLMERAREGDQIKQFLLDRKRSE